MDEALLASVVETPRTAARKAADAFIATSPLPGVIVTYDALFRMGELEPLNPELRYTPKEVTEWAYNRWAFLDSFRTIIAQEMKLGMKTVPALGLELLSADGTIIHAIGITMASLMTALTKGIKILGIPDEAEISQMVLRQKRDFANQTAAVRTLLLKGKK